MPSNLETFLKSKSEAFDEQFGTGSRVATSDGWGYSSAHQQKQSFLSSSLKEAYELGIQEEAVGCFEHCEAARKEGYREGLEAAKGAVPEKDNTTDASEYERADRVAWNACRTQTLANLDALLKEVEV